jgi:hypothetical protein
MEIPSTPASFHFVIAASELRAWSLYMPELTVTTATVGNLTAEPIKLVPSGRIMFERYPRS